mgnify:CR=1 FL=1
MLPPVDLEVCETCRRPKVGCVCDRIVSFETARRVLILQHPQEKDAVLGSAQILTASLPRAKLVIGLSWPNFAAALGEEDASPKKWVQGKDVVVAQPVAPQAEPADHHPERALDLRAPASRAEARVRLDPRVCRGRAHAVR